MTAQRTSARTGLPIWLRLTIVGVLIFTATAASLAYRAARRQPAADAPRVEFTVDGLDCPVWCAVRLSDGIDGLDGALVESMDQKSGKVIVRHDPARQNVAALREAFGVRGFAVQSVEPVERR